MAMLAEPRQRKRYNLVPRGKALYEDETRFGTKMLERMGWKRGQGLGAKEDGSKDFVRIRYKNDALGLGFEERDDQWTQHEQCFNGLLKTLNNEKDDDSNNEKGDTILSENEMQPRVGFGFQETNNGKSKAKVEKMKEKISGVSLEERSKQSKARVHYKKFTKGKDLAQYSEKDLANIFGKKAVEDKDASNDFFQHLSDTFEKNQDNSSGVQMINNGVSVNDYFKTKMESRRTPKKDLDVTENIIDANLISNEIQLKENSRKKDKKKKNQDIEEEQENEQEDQSQMIYSNVSINDYFKSKMEAIKSIKNCTKTEEDAFNIENHCDEVNKEKVTKKKKKGNQGIKDQNSDCLLDPAEKKSKKHKHVADQENFENEIKSEVVDIKRKKKSKKCEVLETLEIPVEETKEKKDKPKNKQKIELRSEYCTIKEIKFDNSQTEIAVSSCLMDPSFDTGLTHEPQKKKKRENKTEKTTDIIELANTGEDVTGNFENQTIIKEKKERKKSKKCKELNEPKNNGDNLTIPNPNEELSNFKRKKFSSAKRGFSGQVLDPENIKTQYEAFNIYPISSFCAEKFRNINLNDFKGSVLPEIEGYGLGPDLKLEVICNKNDEERITNLWRCVLNKYDKLEKPKKLYKHYVDKVFKARKTKQKVPKLNVKTWKRKNLFQAL